MKLPEEFIDRNGFVKPRKDWVDSGNGVLYSSISRILGFDNKFPFQNCMKEPGLLMRTPDNQFGQESHDDYMGVAVASIYGLKPVIPRMILSYGWRHFGFFCNTGFTFRGWLWRFPSLWLLMFAAAFPSCAWIVRFPLWIAQLLQRPQQNDAGGTQLQWLFQMGYIKLYWKNNTYLKWSKKVDMAEAMTGYYDPGHPFIEAFRGTKTVKLPKKRTRDFAAEDKAKMEKWLHTPHSALNGAKPINLFWKEHKRAHDAKMELEETRKTAIRDTIHNSVGDTHEEI